MEPTTATPMMVAEPYLQRRPHNPHP
jgi:hypothetical protein